MRPPAYTGEPHTCRWCGRKLYRTYGLRALARDLKAHAKLYSNNGETIQREDAAVRRRFLESAGQYGPYGDGHFCSLTCGYAYGVHIAGIAEAKPPKGRQP
ncbi:MAG TPA: hypothetical protein VFA33_07620 [Bryobacteraceae bacterium]|nr:hypothetical protein [Bryobacteraceae bacterium]